MTERLKAEPKGPASAAPRPPVDLAKLRAARDDILKIEQPTERDRAVCILATRFLRARGIA